jgi:isocitrate/isopropylmalate dehydrogenase
MENLKEIKVAVLPGDGIGAEVMHAALPLFQELNLPIQLQMGDIGWTFWQQEGNPIPSRTWDLIQTADVTLVGAVTSKPKREAMQELNVNYRLDYISPILQLRQNLDLYANVRPCFNIKKGSQPFNFCIVRENTEGLYAGLDFYPAPQLIHDILKSHVKWRDSCTQDMSCTLRLQTKKGWLRIFEFAFAYAAEKRLPRVTFADKPNVLRESSAFARELFESVAANYPRIKADILNVDAVALWLVRRPQEFGVIVAENMFADILSDVGAAVMGGLGFAPSANMGHRGNYFEPVHGSGPRIEPNCANPSAMFLTIGLMLDFLGFQQQAAEVREAVTWVVQDEVSVTYDLGGNKSTQAMADAILQRLTTG